MSRLNGRKPVEYNINSPKQDHVPVYNETTRLWETVTRLSGSAQTSGSNTFAGNQVISGSLTVTNGITGSLNGTSSNAVSASYSLLAQSASFALSGNGAFTGAFTGAFSGSLANLQGTVSHIPYFSASQVLADSTMFQVDNGPGQGFSIAINQNGVTTAAPEALYVFQESTSSYNVISGKGNLNNYLQLNIQNVNQGGNASSDVVATANNGNESSNYIDMGINSVNFSGSIGLANDAYLYSTGRHLHIGNVSNYPVQIFAGGSDTDANKKLEINPNNQHELTGSLDISGSLIVRNGITGSLQGSSSYAATASYANNFTVAGTLTAQTIVAQTITSSVVYSSGSNKFGNNLSNTHQFTGSVNVTGSISLNGSSLVPSDQTSSLSVATASYAFYAVTASYVLNAVSASYSLSSSYARSASYATNATSASYAITASYVANAQTASYVLSSSYALSSSNAVTASYTINSTSASYASNATSASYSLSASYVQTSQTASYVLSASYATTASYVINAQTASYVLSSSYSANSTSASYALTASYVANAQTASYVLSSSYAANSTSASYSLTASYVANAISSSYALSSSNAITASYVKNSQTASYINPLVQAVIITGSLNVSGSTTQVGNTTLLGNTTISGSLTVSGSIPGSATNVNIYGDTSINGAIKFLPIVENLDTTVSASYIYVSGSTQDLYFTQNGKGYANTTRLRWLEGNLYSGLLSGALITTASSTVYTVGSGSGIIVNLNASLTDNPYPTINYLNWGNLSASIAPLSASYDQSYIGIYASGSNKVPAIIAQGTPFNDGQFDTLIPIGLVLHSNHSTINNIKTQPSLAYGYKQRSNIFIQAFGPLKLSGFPLNTSSSLGVTVGSGTAFLDGANYSIDPNNPSYITDSGTSVSKIWRYYQSGSQWVYDTNGGVGYTVIDPTQYSNNGVLTAVPGGGANRQFSIQRVFWFPNSVSKAIIVYYGNATYATLADGISNIQIESFTEAPNTAANGIFLGSIVVRNNADFTTAASYQLVPAGLFRSVGGQAGGGGTVVTSTLAGLSDVAISGQTNGQPLVWNNVSARWVNSSTLTATLTGNASTATSATSASYALTASFVAGSVANATSASYALTASYTPTSAAATSASYAATASYVLNSVSSSYAATASYVAGSATAISASYAATSSYANNFTVAGTLTAQTIVAQTVTSSVVYASGSNIFGNNLSNTHQFTGSVAITGSLSVNGTIINNLTSSNSVSASYATSASFATTASYVMGGGVSGNGFPFSGSAVITGSLNISGSSNTTVFSNNADTLILTGSAIVTGSLSVIGSVNVSSGVITGSLFGTSSYATNALSSSYATNALSASFATTASYVIGAGSSTNGFPFSGSAVITGSLNISGSAGTTLFSNNADTLVLTGSAIVTGSLTLTGSLNVISGGITGSLLGTASYATNALSASYATTASYALSAAAFPYNGAAVITGSLIISSSTATAPLALKGTGSGVFTVDGTTGRLFQIDDSLSGSLFSVNTISGLPIIEAFSDNTVRIGKFGSKALYVSQSAVGIGKETGLNGVLDVSGSVFITGSLNVSGVINGSVSSAVTASYASSFIIGLSQISTANVASSIVGTNNLFTTATGSFTSAFYKYTATNGSNARAGEVIAVWNAGTTQFTDYSTIDIGNTSNVTASVSIVTSQVQFNVTTGTSGWSIKSQVTYL